MSIKNTFTLVLLLVILFLISNGILNAISISQIKKEYSSLEFIPDEASFVGRIDSKKIGKGLLKEFISKDFFTKLPKEKKREEWPDMSYIDFDYPLYFFTKSVNKRQIVVATIQITDHEAFLKSVNKPDNNSFGFLLGSKGFWIFNCTNKEIDNVKKAITTSKSKKWEKLRNSKHEIGFMTSVLKSIGHIDINDNSLQITASINSLFNSPQTHKKLTTKGLNFTIVNPLSLFNKIGFNDLPSESKLFTGIKALSINHEGYRAPFFPNMTALLQVDTSFNFEESLAKINSSQVEFENNKLYLAGAKFYVSKPQSDCYLLSYKENQSFTIQNTDKIIESDGDLSQLVNFNDAPLMKLFLLSSITISKISSIIEKTDKYNFKLSNVDSSNTHTMNFSIELKKPYSIYGEILTNLFN
jgi:hypothetical protein